MINFSSFVDEFLVLRKMASVTAAGEAAGKVLPFLQKNWKAGGLLGAGGAVALTGAGAKKDWELGRAIRKQQGG